LDALVGDGIDIERGRAIEWRCSILLGRWSVRMVEAEESIRV